VAARLPLLLVEIVKHSDDTKSFVVLPHRWFVVVLDEAVKY
jgi:hypothetical protein